MVLRWLMFLLVMFAGFDLKAQSILLNADSAQIQKEISPYCALMKSTIEKDPKTKVYYKKMLFCPHIIPPEGNDCLLSMTFYLTLKGKCFKYTEDYWGERLANQRIADLEKLYWFKRVKGSLKWINDKTGSEVIKIPEKIGNNKFASVYDLEIKTANNETLLK